MSKPELPSIDEGQDGGLSAALASSRERSGLAQVVGRRTEAAKTGRADDCEARPKGQDLLRLERQLVDFQADFMDVLRRLQDVEAAVRSLRAELQAQRDRSAPVDGRTN